MLKLFQKKLSARVLSAIGAFVFLCSTGEMFGEAVKIGQPQPSHLAQWKSFHSVQGSCSISFPSAPEHVKQIVPLSTEGQSLRYDVYVAAFEKKAVYMLLVAQYPPRVDESYAEISLESFLNGLITQNPENKLIFADLTEVQGHKALDFFIQAGTSYFKGRAVIVESNLYLLAMECSVKNYLEDQFKHFISSFELKK